MRLCLFMNAYNTGPGLHPTLVALERLRAALAVDGIELRAHVQDDASSDGTYERLRGFAQGKGWLSVDHLLINGGNAAGIIGGYQWALDNVDADGFIACCDADGEHDPLAIPLLLDRWLRQDSYDAVIGAVNYPAHMVTSLDYHGMQFLGALQANAAYADGPFTVHSPGFQIHRFGPHITRVINVTLPKYVDYYRHHYGTLSQWGMPGVIAQLLGINGARIHTTYLGCLTTPPNRSAAKLMRQVEAGLEHLRVVRDFMAETTP